VSDRLFNRELSWLEFNERVLEEAQDPTVPLLERVKFPSIFRSNLEEFFMVRVAELKRRVRAGEAPPGADGLSPAQALAAVAARVHELVHEQHRCFLEDILPRLVAAGIRIYHGYAIRSSHAIRVTRDADVALPRSRPPSDLLTAIEERVRERRMGDAVRLQYDADLPPEILGRIVDELELDVPDLYPGEGFPASRPATTTRGPAASTPTSASSPAGRRSARTSPSSSTSSAATRGPCASTISWWRPPGSGRRWPRGSAARPRTPGPGARPASSPR
jgi:polyphosphate kinase